MHKDLVRKEIERRFYGYAPSDIHVVSYKDGQGRVEFLLGGKPSSATFSLKQGFVYLTSGPQDEFYNDYPLIKPPVDPKFDFNTCCERAFGLSEYNGRITNLTLIKRYEDGSWIEFSCDSCRTRLRFDQTNSRAPWSKI